MSTGNIEKKSIARSASLVSVSTAFSRVLGLIREQVMAYFFGASMATDAFVTAFRIPNLLRDLFAEGALASAFVPVFKGKVVNESKEEAFSLANKTITAILLVVGGIVLLGIIATPAIIYISAKGFTADPDKFNLTVSLTRLMFAYLLLVSLSSVVMGMLNSFGRFGIPALSPAMFNIGVIIAVTGLYSLLDMPIYSLAVGVLIGGVGQLVFQLPALFRTGYRFRLDLDLLDSGIKKIFRLFAPMVMGMSAGRINIILNTLLASFLIEGSISYLNYSYRLMHFPLGVFAVALGTVSLPRASELAAKGDMEGLGRSLREAINWNMFLILPSAVFLAMFGTDLVQLVFRRGAFSELDSINTGLALLHYSYGLIGFAAVRVTVPFFYALGDARLPTKISVISVALNMALYYPMIQLLNFAGLAAATSIAALLNFACLLYFVPRKGIPVSVGRLLLSFVRMAVAAGISFYVARMIPPDFLMEGDSIYPRIVNLAIAAGTGGLMYFILCIAFRAVSFADLRAGFSRKKASNG